MFKPPKAADVAKRFGAATAEFAKALANENDENPPPKQPSVRTTLTRPQCFGNLTQAGCTALWKNTTGTVQSRINEFWAANNEARAKNNEAIQEQREKAADR